LRALTVRPAEILGLPQGRLAKGAPADVILVDLDATYEFDADNLRSKSRNSPFDEKQMRGRVKHTIVAGETIYQA
jgi:dihydroorotase